jgi:hypothetical protein
VVLRDLAVMLADGGTTISDIEALRRREEALFGRAASEPTAWRTLEAVAADELALTRLFDALAATRERLWGLGAAPPGWDDPTVAAYLDLDATLVTAHSDKEQAAGTYKGGYGFQPILAFLDRGDGRGEPLGLLLRSGNAGANSVEDNVDVLEQALLWLPDRPAGKPLVVRGDSAMATKGFVAHARSAGVKVSLSLPIGHHPQVQAAVRALHADPAAWTPAVRQDGSVREGAAVAELADVPLGDGWPEDLRIIVRREPLHPGAQQTLDDVDGQRFTALLTDLDDDDIVALDAGHRARARVEDRIKDAKDSGLANLPCADFARNSVWAALVMVAHPRLLGADPAAGRRTGPRAPANPALPAVARRRPHRPPRPARPRPPRRPLALGHRAATGVPTAVGPACPGRLTSRRPHPPTAATHTLPPPSPGPAPARPGTRRSDRQTSAAASAATSSPTTTREVPPTRPQRAHVKNQG